jgi:formylglycine-generating enzyme required for sulfatase activity
MMGSERFYREEGPVHKVTIKPLWIDQFEVTRKRFAEFIAQTGYVTQAEQTPDPALHQTLMKDALVPAATVFTVSIRDGGVGRWSFVPDASWKTPLGVGSTIEDALDLPVTHVSYADA